MNRTKILASFAFLMFALYTNFLFGVQNIPKVDSACRNPVVSAMAAWDSGCFYIAAFENQPTQGQVNYERQKLDTFFEKDGFSHAVLWYRIIFHRRFQDYLEVDQADLDAMHWDYTQADPSRADIQADYIGYLVDRNQNELAQNTLDHYCNLYIRRSEEKYIVDGFESVFDDENIELDLSICRKNSSAPE